MPTSRLAQRSRRAGFAAMVLPLFITLACYAKRGGTGSITDPNVRDRVIACGAGFSEGLKAQLNAEISEGNRQGKAGVELVNFLETSALKLVPESQRNETFGKYLDCLNGVKNSIRVQPDSVKKLEVTTEHPGSPPFALRMRLVGSASVTPARIAVRIDTAMLWYPTRRAVDTIEVEYVRAHLAQPVVGGSWDFVDQSAKVAVNAKLGVGDTVRIKPFTTSIPINGIETLAGKWMVVAAAIPRAGDVDFIYAHSRKDVF